MRIRNSVKAIIIRDGKLLCNKNHDNRGIFYCVPGGGQEYQENLQDALVRECFEEISVPIEVGELLFVRDYIGKNHNGQARLKRIHQVEFFFACELTTDQEPQVGNGPDYYQVGVEWVPIADLERQQFYPKDMIPWLSDLNNTQRPIYLGDMD
ncbi:MAG: NUDIX domain-containing protein [Bacteroidota bacterium]